MFQVEPKWENYKKRRENGKNVNNNMENEKKKNERY